jgi:HAD domain in Swiss Army Knife RNA repair proteins
MILLFLDFDGVLHPTGTDAKPFVNRERLDAVLRDFKGVEVLVSSSWQDLHPPRTALRNLQD